MKKAICWIIITSMVVLLAACGSTATPSSSGSVSIATPDAQSTYNATGQSASPSSSSSSADTVPEEDKYGGTVRIIDMGDFTEPFGLVWQPFVARTYSTPWAEDLVNFKMNGEYEPHLAVDWNVDEEAHTITFKLREGITFTDGSPFNAEAVLWNVKSWYEDNRGDEEILPDQSRVIDEYTVEIVYDEWSAVVFENFASHTYAMVSMENVLKNGKEYGRQNPVGTGPFTLKNWDIGVSVEFERNPDYWQEGLPYLDGVTYLGITDALVQNAALMSDGDDRIDVYAATNAEQAYQLMGMNLDFDTDYMRASGAFMLAPDSMTEENNPLFDVRVRQAISHAINREALVDAMGFGIWQPANQMVSPGFAGNMEPGESPYLDNAIYDPEKARSLLAEAGYPDGFTVPAYALSQFSNQMVAIQAMLEEVGITLALEFPEQGRMQELRDTGWTGILGANWGQVMYTGVSFWMSYNPNMSSYVNAKRFPEFEQLYWDARHAYDISDELWGKAAANILEHQTFIPIYYNNTAYFIRNGLTDHGFKEYTADTIWTPWKAYWAK